MVPVVSSPDDVALLMAKSFREMADKIESGVLKIKDVRHYTDSSHVLEIVIRGHLSADVPVDTYGKL